MSTPTPLDQFCHAIEQAGLHPPVAIIPDGTLHRFASNGDREDDSGWYVYFPDGLPAGAFGCWRLGIKETWCAKSEATMSETERAAHRQRIEVTRQQRDTAERRRHAEAAAWAQQLWAHATPAKDDHPYLKRKAVHPHGLKLYNETVLLVPVMIGHTLTSLELIDEDGDKKFLPGGAVKGGSYTIGDLTEAKTIVICEGYATGASLYEATGYPVVVAFHAGNLTPVAEQLRHQFPTDMIVLCGDHDLSGTGQREAGNAANAIGGRVVLPEEPGMDFNDLAQAQGHAAVKEAIESATRSVTEPATMTTTMMETMETTAETAASTIPTNDPGLTKILADTILRTEHFAQDAGGQLYAFVGGTYRPNGEERITQRVKIILVGNGDSKRWSSHRAREVVEFIRVDASRLWDRPPVDALNLLNGLLDLPSQTLRPHDPAYLSPVQLPVTYDPTATCPLWESFIARVLPEDCQTLPYELVAASMRGEVSDQKSVLLVGAGENGKSTLLGGIVAFLGRENVAGLALHRLELDKFSVVRLLGKLANICADLPSEHLASTSTFKTLTGGDRLTAERKFQGSFEFTPFARLLFSTNHYPRSKDSSPAFFRRWLSIPFEAVIEPHERIPDLAARLADPNTNVLVLDGVAKPFLILCVRCHRSSSFSTRGHFPFGRRPFFSISFRCCSSNSSTMSFTVRPSIAAAIFTRCIISLGIALKNHAPVDFVLMARHGTRRVLLLATSSLDILI